MVATRRNEPMSGRAAINVRPPPALALDRVESGAFDPSRGQEDGEALMAIAAGGSADQARALAQRDDLDERAIDLLAQRPEIEVLCALAANGEAQLGRKSLRRLIERGREESRLARRLLQRDFLHLCHFRLFLQADGEERGHLIALARHCRLDTAHGAKGIPEPDASKRLGLERAADRRDRAGFAHALARALACAPFMARRLADDKGGEPLALALAALGFSDENAARIFLAGFPDVAVSREKFRSLMGIVGSVPTRTAARLVRAIVTEDAAGAN